MSKSIVITSFARTPIGKFCGSLSHLSGPQLGALAIQSAVSSLQTGGNHAESSKSSTSSELKIPIREAYLGNVLQAGIGQAPARQAVLGAGLPESTNCTTVNKVCASGMKAVMLAAQTLQCAAATTSSTATPGFAMLAGGFESMSNVPHYLPASRTGTKLGHATMLDGVIYDGLWDVYNHQHMGMCGEKCAKDFQISRQDQDDYAKESYRRALQAQEQGSFTDIVPVQKQRGRGGDAMVDIIDKDEEPLAFNVNKVSKLKPAFDASNHGTITAANASSLNDGAAALILMTEQDALARNITPLARIVGFGDAEQNPIDFPTAPALAVRVALQQAGLQASDIEYHEINEAFSVVALANMKLLNLPQDRVNVLGGAVALGHPLGMSGARILGTLIQVLQYKNATLGCASICNGGGGASAVILQRLV